jgi:hypothetical protein
MKTSDMFPSKYMKGSDLKGGAPTYTITSVSQEEVGQDREMKFVVYFQGQQKGVVLNKTNAELLEMLFGDESDDWIGEEISLFTMPVTFNGKTTNAIRFRAPKKSAKQQAADVIDALNDEIPF